VAVKEQAGQTGQTGRAGLRWAIQEVLVPEWLPVTARLEKGSAG